MTSRKFQRLSFLKTIMAHCWPFYFSLFLFFFTAKLVFARDWQSGSNGAVKWASNCDFFGGDIGQKSGPAANCGDHCAANSQCTHFTWSNDVCYLKKLSGKAVEVDLNGAVCGFVPSRVKIISNISFQFFII